MTEETFILVYNALVICFFVSLVFAIFVVSSAIRARRAARNRKRDPHLARRLGTLEDETNRLTPEPPKAPDP